MTFSTNPTQETLSSTKTMASASEMIDRLNSLEPDADTKAAARIAELFPALVEAKRRGNSKQQVLTLLSEMGLTLHHAKFSKLFNAEKKAREEHGERICCVTCGQLLVAKAHDEAEERNATHPDVNHATGDEA